MKSKKIVGIVLLAGVCIVAILLFQNRQTQTTGKLTVAATFYPLYEFTKNVGGDIVAVTNVTPAGAEPHDFEPSPQTLVEIQRAKIFIYNGGTFEPWVDKLLRDYKNIAVKASERINLMTTDEGADPHYWLDPVNAQKTVETIRDGLIEAAPEHRESFTKNAAGYIAKLAELDKAFAEGLKVCTGRTIVASHDAFSYVGRRYAIDILPIAGISAEGEPSPSKLAEISKAVREKGITHIFFERLVSPRLADTIARETGAKTASLDPIEGLSNEDQQQGKNYLSIQSENLAALRGTLGCQ